MTPFVLGVAACLITSLAIGGTCPGNAEAYTMLALDGAAAIFTGMVVAAPRRGRSTWNSVTGAGAALVVVALAFAGHIAVFGAFCAS